MSGAVNIGCSAAGRQVLAVVAAAALGAAPALAVRSPGRLGPARLRPQHARPLRPRQRRVSDQTAPRAGCVRDARVLVALHPANG